MSSTPSRPPPPSPPADSPARITAGLIAVDLTRLPIFMLIAAVPGLVEATRPWVSDTESLVFAVVRECFALAVMSFIGATWVQRLRRESTPVPLRSIVWSIGAGLGIWFLFSIPPLLPILESNEIPPFVGAILAIPAVIVGWRYFFLGAPFLLGIRDFPAALTFARNLTRDDPLLPARIMAPALSIKFLLLGILHALSPDGRLGIVSYGAPLLASLAPILGAYATLGWLIHAMSERVWNELHLDPYRQARTTTIIVRGPTILAKLLSLRAAITVIGIAVLVWLGNTVRLAALPPPADIALKTVTISDKRVTLSLAVRDETAHFRGFRPVAFFLASERAFPIARRPEVAAIAGDTRDVRLRFPRDRSDAELSLVFSTDRTSEDLRRLEDVYLWYGGNRLEKIDLKGALTGPSLGLELQPNFPTPATSPP